MHYPFHPRAGEQITTLYSKKYRGEKHFVIEQPDGTYALLPAWMTQQEAGCFQLTSPPTLSLPAIRELKLILNEYHQASNLGKSGEAKDEINASKESISKSQCTKQGPTRKSTKQSHRTAQATTHRKLAAKQKGGKK